MEVLLFQQKNLLTTFTKFILQIRNRKKIFKTEWEGISKAIHRLERCMSKLVFEGLNKTILFQPRPYRELPKDIEMASLLKSIEKKIGSVFLKMSNKKINVFTIRPILISLLYNAITICCKQNKQERLLLVKFESDKDASNVRIVKLGIRIKKKNNDDVKGKILQRYQFIKNNRRCQNIDDLRILAMMRAMSLIGPKFELDL